MIICERCYQPLSEGEHGWMLCPLEPRRVRVSVIDDQIEGGPRFFETLGHEPVFIESKSQLKREAEARGYIPCSRHDAKWHAKNRKMHDERIKDTGMTADGLRVR